MRYYVDIDNTICVTHGSDYENSVPIEENINKINGLYRKGHDIIYHTARGGTSGKDWWEFSWKQLKGWGCLFDDLRTDKPSFDFIIDDKAIKIEEL